jgi:hypothetical protein
MSESDRIFPDISEFDRACGRVCLHKLAAAGAVSLSDEAMPIAVDDDLLRRFEVWSTAPLVLAPRRAWYVRLLGPLRAWIPGTLESRFRRWCNSRAFVVSE